MKKTVRNLIILLLAAVAVGGGIYLLQHTDPEPEAASSAAPDDGSAGPEVLLEKEDADIDSISFSWDEAEYVMAAFEDKEYADETSPGSTAADIISFTIEGLEEYDLVASRIKAAASSLYNIQSIKSLGAVENPADYGLDGNGRGKAEIKYKDGGSDILTIGNDASSGAGRYIMLEGDVYVVTSVSESLFVSPNSFINTALYTVADLTGEDEAGNPAVLQPELTNVVLSGSRLPEPIEIIYSPGGLISHVLTSPMVCDASADRISGLMEALMSLNAGEAVLPGYSDGDLEEYGLKEPYASVEFTMNGESHSISVSEKDLEGSCYLISDDHGVIYSVPWASVSVWADMGLMDIRSTYINLPNIQEVSRISLDNRGAETVLDISRELDEEKSTEDNPQYILTIKSGEIDVDYETVYQPFYKTLISMTILSTEPLEYDAEKPVLSYTYEYFDGGSDTVSFFEVEGMDRYVVELNGHFNGVLRIATVDELADRIAPTGENVVTEG